MDYSLDLQDLEGEVWKDVVGYEGLYQVSDLGRVKSIWYSANRVLSPSNNGGGYLCCVLCKDKVQTSKQIHWLVSMAFLGHTPNRNVILIDHKNGCTFDNRACNLQIATYRENSSICFRRNQANFTSKYVGVSWKKQNNKWQAKIWFNKKSRFLGLFSSEIEASEEYQKALIHIKKEDFYRYWDDVKPKFSSSIKGVCWNECGKKWVTSIMVNGKRVHLGSFSSELEASLARQNALKLIA